MRILLTGGAEFIGSHVAEHLLAHGHEVVIVDALSSGKRENVPADASFFEEDIRSGCEDVFEGFAQRSSATRPPRWMSDTQCTSRTSTLRSTSLGQSAFSRTA